jgi:3-isopropylmalate/(R)-2-methylmalate dehydratase small subunit
MASEITSICATAVPVPGNEIDTDRIIPALYLRCVTFEGLGQHAFKDDRQQDPAHPFDDPRYTGAEILISYRNFGCGSSREHAPQALRRWGIQAIVAESFAEIFFGNCTQLGIPCLTLSEQDCRRLIAMVQAVPSLVLTVDVALARVSLPDGVCFQGQIPAGAQKSLLTGQWDTTATLLAAGPAVDATAAELPYFSGWAI